MLIYQRVTGWWFGVSNHGILWLSIQLAMESLSQLTFTPSFFRGVGLNHQPDNISHGTANTIHNKPMDIGKLWVYWIFNQIIDNNIHWGLLLIIIEIILQPDNNPNGLVKLKPESSTIFRSWSFPGAIFPSNPLRYGMYQLMGICINWFWDGSSYLWNYHMWEK